jgi:hypothetical protein
MEYEYNQEDPETVNFGAKTGGGNLLFRETSKFTTIAEAPTSGDEGATCTITDDHVFAVDEGFIRISTYRASSTAEGETSGEPGFQGKIPYKIKGFMVGDDPITQERAENLRNRGVILLQESPDCNDTRVIQYGCKCEPAVIEKITFNQGDKYTGGRCGYEITFTATCKADYQGDVAEKTL